MQCDLNLLQKQPSPFREELGDVIYWFLEHMKGEICLHIMDLKTKKKRRPIPYEYK